MLEMDQSIFSRCTAIKLQLDELNDRFRILDGNEKNFYYQKVRELESVSYRYNQRQADIKNSFAGKAKEVSDDIAGFISGLWKQLTAPGEDMGALPALLVWPVVAVVAIGAATYLVSEYLDTVTVDFDRTSDLMLELAEKHPDVAEKVIPQYVDHVAKLQGQQTSSFSNITEGIGGGIKTALIISTIVGGGIFAYKQIKNSWKSLFANYFILGWLEP